MAKAGRPTIFAVLLALLGFGNAGCTGRSTDHQRSVTEASRAATEDMIRTVIAESAKAYSSNDCNVAGDAAWLPDQPPYVHFAAEDSVITLATRAEIVDYCQKLARNRVSAHEDIEAQSVHLVTPDVAYVVTRSTQSTQWRDGRTEVIPTVETAIVANRGGRWRVIYKHLSWREAVQRSAADIR